MATVAFALGARLRRWLVALAPTRSRCSTAPRWVWPPSTPRSGSPPGRRRSRCSSCCSSRSTPRCRCRSACALDRFGSRRMVLAGAVTMAAGSSCSALATDVPDRGGRPRAGRRGRRDDVHQRAAGDRAVVPRVDRPAGHPADRHPRPAGPDRGGLSAGRAAARDLVADDVPRRGRRWACSSPCWSLLALRDAPAGTAVRHRPPAAPRCAAGCSTPGRSRAPASGCTPTSSPSSPAPCSRCCGAIRSSWWARGCRPGPRPALLTLLVRRRDGRRPAARPALRPLAAAPLGPGASPSSAPPRAIWTVVLLWPGPAPLWLLVVLVIVLATNGPGSMIGFDFARTENPPNGRAAPAAWSTSAVSSPSLLTILAIGAVLDLLTPGASTDYRLGAFRAAFAVQYVFWAVGLVGVVRHRRQGARPARPRRRRPRSAVRRHAAPGCAGGAAYR